MMTLWLHFSVITFGSSVCVLSSVIGGRVVRNQFDSANLASLRTEEREAHSADYCKVLLSVQVLLRNETIFVCFQFLWIGSLYVEGKIESCYK